MQYILFKEKKIHYKISGKGKLVVLLHGFCEDISMWEEFYPEIDDHKVLRIDFPGFGLSDTIENLSLSICADIVKQVLDDLGHETCSLIGHSMGGYVALAFAEKYKTMIQSLTLFHSHPFEDDDEKIAIRKRSINFIQDNGHVLYVKQLVPTLFAPDYTNELLINRLIYNACSFDPQGIIEALKAMMDRPSRFHVLEQLECPVLFIIGKKDMTSSFDTNMKQTQYPKIAQIEILPKVGHMGMFESPKATSRIIRKFLAFCKAKS